mgnify:CR=1 FL=1
MNSRGWYRKSIRISSRKYRRYRRTCRKECFTLISITRCTRIRLGVHWYRFTRKSMTIWFHLSKVHQKSQGSRRKKKTLWLTNYLLKAKMKNPRQWIKCRAKDTWLQAKASHFSWNVKKVWMHLPIKRWKNQRIPSKFRTLLPQSIRPRLGLRTVSQAWVAQLFNKGSKLVWKYPRGHP